MVWETEVQPQVKSYKKKKKKKKKKLHHAFLFNIQYCKVQIKGKRSKSKERSSTPPTPQHGVT